MMTRYCRGGWRIALGVLVGLIWGGSGCAKKLATVNGVTLTMDQLYERLMKEHGQQTAGALILEQLVLQEAERRNLLPTEEEIQTWLQDFKEAQGIQSDEQWVQFLQLRGVDDPDFLYKGKIELALFKLRTAHLHPTEEELQAFFKEHQANFNIPAMIRFRQIVVEKKEDVDKVREKLAQGFDFSALAKQYSIDPHAQQTGGEVGPVPLEMLPVPPAEQGIGMPQELFQVVRDLPVEQSSPPVPLTVTQPNGEKVTHTFFFLVTERQAQKEVTYDEVRDKVRQLYLQTHGKSQDEVFQQLMQNADVVIYEDRYRALERRFGGQIPQPDIPVPAAAETPAPEAPSGAAPATPAPGGAPGDMGDMAGAGPPAPDRESSPPPSTTPPSGPDAGQGAR